MVETSLEYPYDLDEPLPRGIIQDDIILRHMQKYRHLKWGFVIYRTTYDDDNQWRRFMQILADEAHKTLEFYGRTWIEPNLELTVIEDRKKLQGASKDTVRTLFKDWVTEAIRSGDGQGPLAKNGNDALCPDTPRYRYCLFVDKDSLDSVVNHSSPYLVIIQLDWALPDLENLNPEEDDPLDDGYPPIEGCKLEDVGWMKIPPFMLVTSYKNLHDNGWYTLYVRPPEILNF